MSESIHFGYWGIRGRGQIIRLLLSYTGASWTQKKYYSQDQWKGIGKDQTSLGLPFPNLPYIIKGDFKLSQSRAIMTYIINISSKKQLLGKSIQDQALVNNIMSVFSQILSKCTQLVFNFQSFQSKQAQISAFVDSKLHQFESLIQNKNTVLDYLTLADFILCESSFYIENVFPQIFQKYTYLKNIREAFQSISEIKSYYQREDSVKGPFLPPIGRIKF